MDTTLHFSSAKQDWRSPQDLFDRYNAQYHFVLDAAADHSNHLCKRWFGPGGEHEDALSVTWPLHAGNIWLNPPYSRTLQARFVTKAINEVKRYHATLGADEVGHSVVCLLPARTDTRLFHNLVYDEDLEKRRYPVASLRLLKGRLKFGMDLTRPELVQTVRDWDGTSAKTVAKVLGLPKVAVDAIRRGDSDVREKAPFPSMIVRLGY